jgi:hypothetical protein
VSGQLRTRDGFQPVPYSQATESSVAAVASTNYMGTADYLNYNADE